jgi:hypothetical protein
MTAPMVTTVFRWRSGSGLFTTLVAKLAVSVEGRGTPTEPLPLVAFDRAWEGGRLAEVSEQAPWTSVASLVAHGSGYRFTLETRQGPLVVQPAGFGVGVPMSAPERARYSATPPRRGPDQLLVIAEGVDGRFFVGAPASQQFAALRGDERCVFESGRGRFAAALPGLLVTATVAIAGVQRRLVLTPDLVVVHATGCVQIVSRVTLAGEGQPQGFALLPIMQAAGLDRGDGAPHAPERPRRGAAPPTAELDAGALRRMAGEVPFAAPPRLGRSESPKPAATPFDQGFAPAAVVPGVGVDSTLGPEAKIDAGSLLEKVALLRASRGQSAIPGAQGPAIPSPAIPSPAIPSPAIPGPAIPGPAIPEPKPTATAAEPPRQAVAPPRAGAMAKPRFKRR